MRVGVRRWTFKVCANDYVVLAGSSHEAAMHSRKPLSTLDYLPGRCNFKLFFLFLLVRCDVYLVPVDESST